MELAIEILLCNHDRQTNETPRRKIKIVQACFKVILKHSSVFARTKENLERNTVIR